MREKSSHAKKRAVMIVVLAARTHRIGDETKYSGKRTPQVAAWGGGFSLQSSCSDTLDVELAVRRGRDVLGLWGCGCRHIKYVACCVSNQHVGVSALN